MVFESRGGGDPPELRWVRSPVDWGSYGLPEDDLLQIFFMQAGGGGGATHPIAEVVLVESSEAVSITLLERVLVGESRDGVTVARPLAGITGCLSIGLAAALGDRAVIDGSTGRRARRTDRHPDVLHVEEPGWLSAECPRWMP